MIPNLSYGRMDKFESCPALYEAKYIDKIPEMPSFPLQSGIAIHAFLDLYLGHLERQEITDDPAVVDDMVRSVFLGEDAPTNTEVFRDVMIVARIFAKNYRHNYAATIGREEWIHRDLEPDDDCPYTTNIVGRYDRLYVDGEVGSGSEIYVVRDYKTGHDATLSTSNDFQGRLYVWMLTMLYPVMAGRLAYEVEFVRHGKTVRAKMMNEWDLRDIEQRVRVIRARIHQAHQKDHFPAVPGWHCSYCPISVRCAKRTSLVRADAMIDNEESALVALGDAIVLESALKNRRKQLQEYSKRAAPPALPDGTVAGYSTKQSVVLRDVEGLIEALGVDGALPYLSVDNRRVKKLQDVPSVAPLFVEESKSRFEIANRAALALPAGVGGEGDEEAE